MWRVLAFPREVQGHRDGQTNRVLYRIARNEVSVSNTNEINTVSDIKKNEDCWAYRVMIDELGAMFPKLISNT